MLSPTLFTVQAEALERLSDGDAVEVFRELLWAEARAVGLPTSKIRVSELVDVADGGIDATVEGGLPKSADLLREGRTGYQIKASSAFKPWQEATIKKELFGDKKEPTLENLGSGIRACLDAGGTYILVCFRQDPVDKNYRDAIKYLKKYLKLCGYCKPKVDVWGRSTLIGFLQRFPSLALRVTGRDHHNFQSHRSWSNNDDMQKTYEAGEGQLEHISALKEELRSNDRAVHIRVGGEPGIGKTRLVLEATKDEDLRPLVLYCHDPEQLLDSDLMRDLLRDDNVFSAVLVVDECDPESTALIWNRLKRRGARIKLISIYNEDSTWGGTAYFELSSLDDEQILKIFEGYGLPKDQAYRWVEMCDGSPRVAHVIGGNLKENPEDLLKAPDTVRIWDRYVCGADDPTSERVHQRKLVLDYVSLFKRFGYEPPKLEEARAIHEMVEQADRNITWHRFREIVAGLRRRKILQGGTTLYITPKALHVKLWIDWWETYGSGFDVEQFYNGLTEMLTDWFNEMFRYAAGSPVASRVAKDLLEEGGPFQNSDLLRSELGANFFLALTEADPRSALRTLERTIGRMSRPQLLEFTTGRRQVVWALEKIAVWRYLFGSAAKLLLALGEAENERYSNNASGVFAGLFSPGPGQVAPTETPPDERLPILAEALNSDSQERTLLALSACDQALESRHFSRIGGLENQGLWPSARLWTPNTYGELFDYYRRVWGLVRESLDNFSEVERQRAVDVLLGHIRGLGTIDSLADTIVDTLSELAKKPYVDEKKVLEKVIQILHYERDMLSSRNRGRWEQLKNQLTGEGFHAMMRRYVGMDVLEDKFDEQGNHVDPVQLRIEELTQQAVTRSDLLKQELRWLVTSEARNGFRFGYELGKRDLGMGLISTLLEAQKNAGTASTGYFLGGYFRALFEKDQSGWEEQLDALAANEQLRTLVPELTWRSGMTDRAALRVLRLCEEGAVSSSDVRIFALGSVSKRLSEQVLARFVRFLLDDSSLDAPLVALDLIHAYYYNEELTLPKELTRRVLTHPSLLEKRDLGQRGQMDEYHWTEVAMSFMQLHPEEALALADFVLAHFEEDGTIFEGFFSQTHNVLREIIRAHPEQAWAQITKYLGPPIDARAFGIKHWLRGEDFFEPGAEGALNLVPAEAIWRWVDEDVEQRGWYIASMVPPTLSAEEERVCLAREVLVRYGDWEDVRRNLMLNFMTEGWVGSRSLHLQTKRDRLLQYREGESDPNVRLWIDEYVLSLNKDIEAARVEEERERF